MRDRVLLVFTAGLIVISGVMLLRGPDDPVVSEGKVTFEEPIKLIETFEFASDMEPAQKVSFWNEELEIIVIDLKTGNVTITKGLEMDEASREFWKILRLHFVPCPSVEKEEQP